MEESTDVVVVLDIGMTGTAITFSTSTNPLHIETVNWDTEAAKGPTALAYPIRRLSGASDQVLQTKELILAGHEAIEALAKPQEYRVVQWWKLHLAEEYVEATRKYGGVHQDLTDVKTYYTDFLTILHRATKSCVEYELNDLQLQWSDLRVRFEFTWPSNWSQVTKETYLDCIEAAGFRQHANHQDQLQSASLICDAGGGTTDICIVKARAKETNRFDLCLTKKSVCLGGTDVDQKLQQLLLGRLHQLKLSRDDTLRVAERMQNDGAWLRIKQDFKFKDQADPRIYSLRIPTEDSQLLQDLATAHIVSGRLYLSREDLIEVFAEPLRKLRDVVIQTWEQCSPDIDVIVGCGGCFYMPYLRGLFQEWITRQGALTRLSCPALPEFAVSHGVLRWRQSLGFFNSFGFTVSRCAFESCGASTSSGTWFGDGQLEHSGSDVGLLCGTSMIAQSNCERQYAYQEGRGFLFITIMMRLSTIQRAKSGEPNKVHVPVCQLRYHTSAHLWPKPRALIKESIRCTLDTQALELTITETRDTIEVRDLALQRLDTEDEYMDKIVVQRVASTVARKDWAKASIFGNKF
ncbi:hypothetical protein MMC30_000836 [Trapelia coarctata]|nr:hypothetical protein [Trapelia coarctata]